MANVYTAQEIREAADNFWVGGVISEVMDEDGRVVKQIKHDAIIAMLRQAADAMEQEELRKNSVTMEYCFVENDGCRVQFLYDSLEDARRSAARMGYGVKCFIRREIGQWEEVKDGE